MLFSHAAGTGVVCPAKPAGSRRTRTNPDKPLPAAAHDDKTGLPVPVADAEPVELDVELWLAVALDEGVPVSLDVELRLAVALDEGVPVWLDVELQLAVALDEGVLVWLPVALEELVPVELGELLAVAEGVLDADRLFRPRSMYP